MDFRLMYRKTSVHVVIWILALHRICDIEASELLYSVAEELKPGTVVGHMFKDLSFEIQAIIHRELHVISEADVEYFDVDPTSGALVIRQEVDKESICRSSSLCHIRAQILLQKLLEVHHVTFEVMDVNDNMLVSQTKKTSLWRFPKLPHLEPVSV